MDDLEKVKIPHISHDPAETERRLAVAHELFDGLLEVRPWGYDPGLSLWDPISTWMGVENALYAHRRQAGDDACAGGAHDGGLPEHAGPARSGGLAVRAAEP